MYFRAWVEIPRKG